MAPERALNETLLAAEQRECCKRPAPVRLTSTLPRRATSSRPVLDHLTAASGAEMASRQLSDDAGQVEPEKNTAPHGHESPGIYLPIPVLNLIGIACNLSTYLLQLGTHDDYGPSMHTAVWLCVTTA